MYVSGLKMGSIIECYLIENDMFTPENYKEAYLECRNRVRRIQEGEGQGMRYRYFDGEIIPVLIDWKLRKRKVK